MSEIKDYVLEKTSVVNKNILKTLDENGGNSDFSIAWLKLIDAREASRSFQTSIGIRYVTITDDALKLVEYYCPINGETTIPILLYKGKNISITPEDLIGVTSISILSGDIVSSESDGLFIITGDCTIKVGPTSGSPQ